MSSIPQESITEILTRLPVKPLLRFRCVCKQWHALIDSQRFIKLHLNHSLNSHCGSKLLLTGKHIHSIELDTIFSTDLTEVATVEPPIRFREIGIEIIGCCNGLVSLYDSNYYNHEPVVMLWNPSTRKFKELPYLGSSNVDYNLGFGYDAVHDDYKVVKIQPLINVSMSHFKVYSLKSNSWRTIDFSYRCKHGVAPGVFAVGCLHWIMVSGVTGVYQPFQVITAFDLATEEIRLVPQPECSVREGSRMDLAVLGGHLCLLFSVQRDYADIWIMKDYGVKESWTKLVSFVQSDFMGFGNLAPISFSKSGKQILLKKDDDALACYDLEAKSAWNINLQGSPNVFLQFGVCSESLVQPNYCLPADAKGGHQGLSKKNKNVKSDGFLSTGFKLVL